MKIKTKFWFGDCLAYEKLTSIGYPDCAFLHVEKITITENNNRTMYDICYTGEDGVTKEESELKLVYKGRKGE